MISDREIIILEGIDKSGKSTVYQHLRRATDYQPFVWDRGIGSNLVYDRLYQREEDRTQEYLEMEARMISGPQVLGVYLKSPMDIIKARLRGEQQHFGEDGGLSLLTEATSIYNRYLMDTPLLYTQLDTSKKSPEDIVVNIAQSRSKLLMFRRRLGYHWLMAVRRVLKAGTNRTSDGRTLTRELTNMSIDLSLNDLTMGDERMVKDFVRLYDNTCSQKLEEKRFQEEEYHASLFHTMRHKVRATNFFFKQGKNSRKNIIFCDDCISSIQFMHRKEKSHMWVHMRSSDIINLLPVDLEAIVRIARDVSMTTNTDIHIQIASAHIYNVDLNRAVKLNDELEKRWNNGRPKGESGE